MHDTADVSPRIQKKFCRSVCSLHFFSCFNNLLTVDMHSVFICNKHSLVVNSLCRSEIMSILNTSSRHISKEESSCHESKIQGFTKAKDSNIQTITKLSYINDEYVYCISSKLFSITMHQWSKNNIIHKNDNTTIQWIFISMTIELTTTTLCHSIEKCWLQARWIENQLQ